MLGDPPWFLSSPLPQSLHIGFWLYPSVWLPSHSHGPPPPPPSHQTDGQDYKGWTLAL